MLTCYPHSLLCHPSARSVTLAEKAKLYLVEPRLFESKKVNNIAAALNLSHAMYSEVKEMNYIIPWIQEGRFQLVLTFDSGE